MLISSSILNSSFENYQKKLKERENYKEDTTKSILLGVDSAFALFFLMASAILFMAELMILLFFIGNAIACTKPGAERTLHLILIIFFTYPYAFGVAFLGNGCMKGRLQSNILFQ